MKTDKLVPFLTKKEIASLVTDLAKRISADYQKLLAPGEELIAVTTLKGAVFFASDLLRELTVPTRMDFVRVASYGAGTKSSGTVRFLMDIEQAPEGKHVLVLDEIVDSGRTLKFLFERLHSTSPKSLKICSLLSKPSRREVDVHVDYLGKEIEDKFLVGYGLDYAEKYRNLSDIFYVES